MKLVATTAILYQNRIYEPGETLPTADAALVEAWLHAGSAEQQQEDDQSDTAFTDEANTQPQVQEQMSAENDAAPAASAPRRRGRNG